MKMTMEEAEKIILSQAARIYKLEEEIDSIKFLETLHYDSYKEEKEKNKKLTARIEKLEIQADNNNIVKVG